MSWKNKPKLKKKIYQGLDKISSSNTDNWNMNKSLIEDETDAKKWQRKNISQI